MVFAPNNALIYDAAFSAALGGSLTGGWLTDTTGTDYDGAKRRAVFFCTLVDSGIAFDAGMNSQKAQLMACICAATWTGRSLAAPIGDDSDATLLAKLGPVATGCVTVYNEAVSNLF